MKRGILANAAAITATGLVIGALGAAALTRSSAACCTKPSRSTPWTFAGMAGPLFAPVWSPHLPGGGRAVSPASPLEAMRME